MNSSYFFEFCSQTKVTNSCFLFTVAFKPLLSQGRSTWIGIKSRGLLVWVSVDRVISVHSRISCVKTWVVPRCSIGVSGRFLVLQTAIWSPCCSTYTERPSGALEKQLPIIFHWTKQFFSWLRHTDCQYTLEWLWPKPNNWKQQKVHSSRIALLFKLYEIRCLCTKYED